MVQFDRSDEALLWPYLGCAFLIIIAHMNTHSPKSSFSILLHRKSVMCLFLIISISGSLLGEPDPPVKLHLSDFDDVSCVIRWQSPSDDGGSPITSYVIEQLGVSWKTANLNSENNWQTQK